jgi:hypothetical protein
MCYHATVTVNRHGILPYSRNSEETNVRNTCGLLHNVKVKIKRRGCLYLSARTTFIEGQ